MNAGKRKAAAPRAAERRREPLIVGCRNTTSLLFFELMIKTLRSSSLQPPSAQPHLHGTYTQHRCILAQAKEHSLTSMIQRVCSAHLSTH